MKILKIGTISKEDKSNMKKIDIPEKSILHDLYVNKSMSLSAIASNFSTTSMTVRSWLNKLEIEVRPSNISLYKEIKEVQFSDLQKSIIIGSILGDGCLRIPKRGKNAYFTEKHCEDQLQYLQWKKDLLKPFASDKVYMSKGGNHVINDVKCTTQNTHKFSTISHPYLTELWKKFYNGNGNKVIHYDIESMINIMVIAIWICDDGSLVWNNIRRTYRIDLHTENFSYDENVYLCRVLNKFFKGTILVIPRKYKSGIKYYLSLRGKEHLHALCKEIKQFVHSSMFYKFDTHI